LREIVRFLEFNKNRAFGLRKDVQTLDDKMEKFLREKWKSFDLELTVTQKACASLISFAQPTCHDEIIYSNYRKVTQIAE